MNKKIVFATIPMLPSDNLKPLRYRKEESGELYSEPSRFPAIPMLEWSIFGTEEVKIVTVRTDDDNKYTEKNYELFKEELQALGDSIGAKLEIGAEIVLPHEETKEKQMQILKEVCAQYEKNADVYMELTYGTKITPIALFSSLSYAEKIKHCNIKSVIYGKYSFSGDIGNLYDIRCLYDMAGLIDSLEFMPDENIESVLDEMWG